MRSLNRGSGYARHTGRPRLPGPQISQPSRFRLSRDLVSRAAAPVAQSDVDESARPAQAPWWNKRPQENFLNASGLREVVDVLQHNADRLVLLDFFAPWCNSCKALYPKVSQLCSQNPQIVVVKVNFEENRELAKKLGIKVLPYFHAYHGSMGRVAAFSCSVTKIQRLKDCISIFGQPYCDLQEHEGKLSIAKSLPEFENLPTPVDATILSVSDGEYDTNASGKGTSTDLMQMDVTGRGFAPIVAVPRMIIQTGPVIRLCKQYVLESVCFGVKYGFSVKCNYSNR